ncbi:probable disease resistance RPP8-like protein 2 [Macadamia integrifolia]|uniref:probable disease resistance RPP8-like protein 2 n=1 Tax=Macadamia integrifolia TaxID=60698 RepID=UPI001C4E9CD1|nr:probable disease resistance RPP8-like protein 2 [Macadamia integrifolia]
MATGVLTLVQKLGSLVTDEVNYLLEVKPEVESLHNELMLMTAYLKDADAMHNKCERVKEWVRQLRELAFQAEDAIDVFVYQVMQKRRDGFVWKFTKYPKLLIDAHNLRRKIEDIKVKIQKLSDLKPTLEIHPFEEGNSSAQAHQLGTSGDKNFPYIDVVGLQSEAEELANLLMQEAPLGRFSVVSITGMGGLGKTTLARKIYNRGDVKRHFDCQAWVYISKEYKMRDVLYKIIEQVMVLSEAEKVALASMEAGVLETRLSDFLKEKKNYLFVLDDIWATEDWDRLKGSFPVPRNNQQCRVLLTTRDEGVARYADPIASPHKLQLLDEDKSLELFLQVIFKSPVDRDAEASLNEEMKDLAKKMVAKCDRLPLAIVVLGGLLSTRRRTVVAWKNVVDSVNWYLDSSNCHKALALSYVELPSHLKPCFLYFGLLPEDTEIQRERMIRLWVAEGFLEPRGNLRMEDVGGECLEELMQRNLIQVAKWKSNGEPESFILHDLLLNLATSEARKGDWIKGGLEMLKGLRELRVLGGEDGLMDIFGEALYRALANLVSLEVLYLQDYGIGGLLPSFSGHAHLYEINIVGCINELPGLPWSLTKLRLACTHLMEDMMVTLEKLPNLKELILDWHPYEGVVMRCSATGFPKLENLTLLYFDWLKYWVVEEGAMPNLRILEMNRLFGLKWVPGGLKHITTLQKLTLVMPKEFLERIKEGGEDWQKIKHIPSIIPWEVEIPEINAQHLDDMENRWFTRTGEVIPDDH